MDQTKDLSMYLIIKIDFTVIVDQIPRQDIAIDQCLILLTNLKSQ